MKDKFKLNSASFFPKQIPVCCLDAMIKFYVHNIYFSQSRDCLQFPEKFPDTSLEARENFPDAGEEIWVL